MKTKKTTDRKSRIKQGKEYPISMRRQIVSESIHTINKNGESNLKTVGGTEDTKKHENIRAISSALNSKSLTYCINDLYSLSSKVSGDVLHPLYVKWINLCVSISLEKGLITNGEADNLMVNNNTPMNYVFSELNPKLSTQSYQETL